MNRTICLTTPLLFSPAIDSFEADKTNPDLLSLSPYPTAFTANASKNYFLTKVGLLKDFLCPSASSGVSGSTYFRVGSEGSCATANCNGVLPDGSTIKYDTHLIFFSFVFVMCRHISKSSFSFMVLVLLETPLDFKHVHFFISVLSISFLILPTRQFYPRQSGLMTFLCTPVRAYNCHSAL